jgi:hypothetical protein
VPRIHTDGSKMSSPFPAEAVVAFPTEDLTLGTLVLSSPPIQTITRAEFAAHDVGLDAGVTHLLTDNACSLRLIQKYFRLSTSLQHHLHKDVLQAIHDKIKHRTDLGTLAHLSKIRVHNGSVAMTLFITSSQRQRMGNAPLSCTPRI